MPLLTISKNKIQNLVEKKIAPMKTVNFITSNSLLR